MPLFRRPEPILDTGDFTVETKFCDECAVHYARVTGYVHQPDDGPTLAAYYAVCHGHPQHEVAMDLIVGSWGDGAPDDHETFSCLVRPDGATAVDPLVTLSFGEGDELPAVMGRPMSREEALASPRMATVWAIVDAVALTVAPIAEQITAHHGGAGRR